MFAKIGKRELDAIDKETAAKLDEIIKKENINFPGKLIEYLKETDPELSEIALKWPYYPYIKHVMEIRKEDRRFKRRENEYHKKKKKELEELKKTN